jgi:hypothetical protein
MKKNFLHPPKTGESRTKRAGTPGETRGFGKARKTLRNVGDATNGTAGL